MVVEAGPKLFVLPLSIMCDVLHRAIDLNHRNMYVTSNYNPNYVYLPENVWTEETVLEI